MLSGIRLSVDVPLAQRLNFKASSWSGLIRPHESHSRRHKTPLPPGPGILPLLLLSNCLVLKVVCEYFSALSCQKRHSLWVLFYGPSNYIAHHFKRFLYRYPGLFRYMASSVPTKPATSYDSLPLNKRWGFYKLQLPDTHCCCLYPGNARRYRSDPTAAIMTSATLSLGVLRCHLCVQSKVDILT
jgi:hypothetical protein